MKNKAIKIFVLISFFFTWRSGMPVFSQQPLVKSFDIRTENTRPRIIKLIHDHNGRIWTGTDKGIFTFDGISFKKIYSPDSGISLVSALYEDKNFCIWAGFENGKIICIKNQKIIPVTKKEDSLKVAISGFAEDSQGRIFYSTKGQGVYYIEDNHFYNINQDDGMSDDYCYTMVGLADGRMCIGTDAGINFVEVKNGKKIVTDFGTSNGLPDDIVREIVRDKNNMIWIGFHEGGLARFDCSLNKISPSNIKNPWTYGQINNIQIVDDQLWVSTEDKGVIIVDRDGSYFPLKLGGDANIKASDLLLDFENNVWIAESIHLYRTSGNKITIFQSIGNKKLEYIHCITADEKGNIWFSPDQQLGHIYRTSDGAYKYKEYHILDKFIDIVSLYFDPYGFLWIGTLGAGVYRFNPATGACRKVTETLNSSNSNVLSINGKGDVIWVAGFSSVMKFVIRANGNSDRALIELVPAFGDSNILNDYVYSVFMDSKGRAWFATDGSGVFYYDDVKLNNIPVTDNVVHSFTEDKKGRIWYSTADAGLEYIESNQTVHKFQTKDGLSDPSPTSILCTSTGNILVVHENGFDVLNPENKTIIYHSSEENLSDLNCDLNSISESIDSSVWIGTERGIIHYLPSAEMKLQRPKIVLQSVSVFLNVIDFQDNKVFDSDENNFRFDFDGLWYSDPQRVNYVFKLEGYSPKWESTKDHTVTFPKLPPGKYNFRVKASLNGIFENADESTYNFEILPPIWQRWWFRFVSAGVIVLIVFILVRRREERLRKFDKIQKEKIEFQFETLKSQVNPHFLFNSFNTLISVIENTPDKALEYVERLSEFYRNIVTYRDKNLIRISEELNILDDYVFIQKKRFGENLQLIKNIEESVKTNKYIAPLTLQLLAENAIKHNSVSRETPLTISIISTNENLIISNNINPKISPENSTGLGLANIISRYELLTAEKVEVASEENKFVVSIPLITFMHEYPDN